MQFNFSQVTCSLGKFSNSHFRRPPNYFCSNIGTGSGNTQMSSRVSYRARERSLTGSKKKGLKENWLKTDFGWDSVSTQKMCCCFYLQRWHTSDRRARPAGIKGLLKPQIWHNKATFPVLKTKHTRYEQCTRLIYFHIYRGKDTSCSYSWSLNITRAYSHPEQNS